MKIRIFSPYERPLAITESKLEQICDVYDRHAAGEKIDVEGLKAALPVQKSSRDTGGHGYSIEDGVAIIDVEGILGKSMNIFMWFSGGTSTEYLKKDISDAVADPGVHSILLRIDSPGGDVDGTQLAADAIVEAAKKKPVVAWITGLGASAAYWLAASAGKIYLADNTTMVGSIGVVAQHIDRSQADTQRGIKRTEITAGKYKRIASDTAPLSQEGRASIQEIIDHMYSVFVDAVAAGRGASVDSVLADMADGRTFIGQKAVDAGLADGIKTFDSVLSQLNADYLQGLQQPGALASAIHSTGESTMDVITQEQMDAATAAALERGLIQGRTEGATAELARIKGVFGAAMPGHAKLVKELAFDGKTTPGEAAQKVIAAEQASLQAAGKDLEDDAHAPAPGASIDPAAEAAEQKLREAAAKEQGTEASAEEQDPQALAAKASAYVQEQKAKGNVVSISQAMSAVTAKK